MGDSRLFGTDEEVNGVFRDIRRLQEFLRVRGAALVVGVAVANLEGQQLAAQSAGLVHFVDGQAHGPFERDAGSGALARERQRRADADGVGGKGTLVHGHTAEGNRP
jgi:hypothetical protein